MGALVKPINWTRVRQAFRDWPSPLIPAGEAPVMKFG
jgi:hypothetical protein